MSNLSPASGRQDLVTLSNRYPVGEIATEPRVGRFVMFGLFILTFFVGGTVYWSISARLDGAVVAPATIVVEGNRKTVQHLDGGIVRALPVSDGDFVKAGQILLKFDSTEADVELDVLGSQIGELVTRKARLLAQLDGGGRFNEGHILRLAPQGLPKSHWQLTFLTQRELFNKELRARQAEDDIQTQRIASLRAEIAGLQEQRTANTRQVAIAEEELAGLESLFEKGWVAAPRLNAIRSDIERLAGQDASFRTQQARAKNEIGELKLSGLSQQKLRDEAIATELSAVEAQLANVEPRYQGALERRKRITVVAPVDGRVVNMNIHTAGGVIRPGEEILDIVPANEALIVEARINTADIEKLVVGQTTRVRLTAFDKSDVPEAAGRIYDISADSLQDDRTGDEYFVAKVKLDTEQSADVEELVLLPGMPADLFVNTGERTAISYLAQPLSDRIARTFIE